MKDQNVENPWAVCYVFQDKPTSIGYILNEENGVLEIRDQKQHITNHHIGTKRR